MNKLLEQINKTSKFKLGKISEVRRGASPRPIHNFITSSGMPWIKIADVTSIESRFVERTKEFIKEDGVKHSVIVKPGDLILSNSATPGIPKFLGMTACIHDGWLLIKPEEKIIDKNYLYYKLLTIRKILKNSVSGAIFDNLKTDIIKDFQIDLPDLPTQKKIVSILSVYDEKIENNNKIIKNLEETAQTIFNEWFVNFKFPGYEKVKMVDSETGEIPEGWEIKSLNEISDIIFGFNFKSKKFNEEKIGVPVVRIRDILNGETKTFTPEIPNDEYKINSGDLLIGMDGTFHCSFWYTQGAYLNQRVARIRSELPGYFIFESVRLQLDFLQRTITGATVGHLANGDIRNFKILTPKDASILKPFENITKEILTLKKEIISLKSQRDLLLAKLI